MCTGTEGQPAPLPLAVNRTLTHTTRKIPTRKFLRRCYCLKADGESLNPFPLLNPYVLEQSQRKKERKEEKRERKRRRKRKKWRRLDRKPQETGQGRTSDGCGLDVSTRWEKGFLFCTGEYSLTALQKEKKNLRVKSNKKRKGER